jgi:hypothetical protein
LAPSAGSASPLAAVTYHLQMPASLEKNELAVFEMSHASANCAKIEPMSHETAAELVANMVAELNSGCMTELGEPVVAESDPDDVEVVKSPTNTPTSS